MLNDMSFCFYNNRQGIKSAKMIAKLERTFSTALQNKKAKNNNKKQTYKTSLNLLNLQFNLLLSPYPCFISLLYLDLYVLGDDALIS